MIKKVTIYAIYADQTQDDGAVIKVSSEGRALPYIKNSKDIENWELLLLQKTGKMHKITQWFPVKKEYIWFDGLKELFKRKK